MRTVIVTRHPALVEYLKKHYKLKPDDVIRHVRGPDELKNSIVWGVLPLHLIPYCSEFYSVSVIIPYELRGRELSLKTLEDMSVTVRRVFIRTEPVPKIRN